MAANDQLHQFTAYRKSCEPFDLVVEDMGHLATNPLCTRLVSQQIASADSVSSNIEEGYGRESRADDRRFLVIARGSETETRSRDENRFKHWLPTETIANRVHLCDEIVAILSATIRTLRAHP